MYFQTKRRDCKLKFLKIVETVYKFVYVNRSSTHQKMQIQQNLYSQNNFYFNVRTKQKVHTKPMEPSTTFKAYKHFIMEFIIRWEVFYIWIVSNHISVTPLHWTRECSGNIQFHLHAVAFLSVCDQKDLQILWTTLHFVLSFESTIKRWKLSKLLRSLSAVIIATLDSKRRKISGDIWRRTTVRSHIDTSAGFARKSIKIRPTSTFTGANHMARNSYSIWNQ